MCARTTTPSARRRRSGRRRGGRWCARRRGRAARPEKPWHQISSRPRGSSPGAASSGPSLPCAMIVGPAIPSPITPTCGGASARAISSRKIAWVCRLAAAAVLGGPGQARVAGLAELPAHRVRRFVEARRSAAVALRPAGALIQVRTSPRKAASSGVSRRSTAMLLRTNGRIRRTSLKLFSGWVS